MITEDDPRWPAVSELIEGMDVGNAVGSVFSKQEYDKASVLALRTNEVKYPQPEDDYFRFTFSEKSGCPGVDRASDEMGRIKGCGSGYVQTSPFRLKSLPKMEKLHIFGLHWEFDALFLRRDIYEQYFQPLGLGYWPVLHHKSGREFEEAVQLKIIEEVDVDVQDLDYVDCPVCGRRKYHPVTVGFYPAPVSIPAPIFKSVQKFGHGSGSWSYVMVSRELYRTIKKAKLRVAVFEPCAEKGRNRIDNQ